MSKLSLKSVVKSVNSVNRAVQSLSVKTLPPSKPPALVLSAERGDLDDLLRKNAEYVERVITTQADMLGSISETVDVLTTKLSDATRVSNLIRFLNRLYL